MLIWAKCGESCSQPCWSQDGAREVFFLLTIIIVANKDRLFNKFHHLVPPADCHLCHVLRDHVHPTCESVLVRECWFWMAPKTAWNVARAWKNIKLWILKSHVWNWHHGGWNNLNSWCLCSASLSVCCLREESFETWSYEKWNSFEAYIKIQISLI